MNLFALLLLALTPATTPLKPVRNTDLTVALSYQYELASTSKDRDARYIVRVYEVITSINECGGPITSCPDVDLYVAVSERDLGAEPALFRLPRAKGWEFVRWLSTCPSTEDEPKIGVVVRTVLPESNISADERARWVATEYEVCVSPLSASFAKKQHNHGSQPTDGAPSSGASRPSGPQRAVCG